MTNEKFAAAIVEAGSRQTYCVRVEYPVVAYATAEIEAASPEEAIERARAFDADGRLTYDEDHETMGDQTSFYVFDAEEEDAEPILIERSAYERIADTGEHLLDALKGVIGYARSRAEDMHEAAERSGESVAFALWLKADAAITTAQRWIDRLEG